MVLQPNNQQQRVINEITLLMTRLGFKSTPHGDKPFIVTVAGFAGTGKTFTICQLRREIAKHFPNVNVAFVTFTGKASSVLREKLTEEGVLCHEDFVGTIHSLIYKPISRWDKQLKTHVITGWQKKSEDDVWHGLIIIDEASMVSKDIWLDLKSFYRSIIAVGDHGQLPPIGDSFNLLHSPHFTLTKIERQALNSPIIYLSKMVRIKGYVPNDTIYSPGVFKLGWQTKKCKDLWNKIKFNKEIITLCGFNVTRANLNDDIRTRLGYTKKEPYPGERIVCLANDHYTKIMNGQICTVLWVMPEDYDLYRITLEVDNGDTHEVLASNKCFGQVQHTLYDKKKRGREQYRYANDKGFQAINYFDYGYCISVHKSQGSEWNKVIVFEQRSKHWDDIFYARWLYTAITRSREKLFLISDFYD